MRLNKIILSTVIVCSISLSTSVQAVENETEDHDPGYWPELMMRPAGLCSSVLGLAAFVASSPFAGLASIPEPHDAFSITYNAFVETPFRYTFTRPLGDYNLAIDAD